MPESKEKKLAVYDIDTHSFETAKKELQQYSEAHQYNTDLMRVQRTGGLFGLFDHKVTGDELNELVSQIQDYFCDFKQIQLGLENEVIQVYKALEALDKDYITAIVDSFKATEEVNAKAKKNRKDIEDTIANQEKTIKVLKNFKQRLEKLEHLADIDQAWELLNEHQETLRLLLHFQDEISKIEHIGDVDKLWNRQTEVDDQLNKLVADLSRTEKAIRAAEKTLATHREAISKTEALLNEQQSKTDILTKNFGEIESSMAEAKESIAKLWDEADTQKTLAQERKKELDTRLDSLEQTSADMIQELRDTMVEKNDLLAARCEMLTNKVRYAFWIAGGALTVAVVQFILNLAGVF